MLAAIRQARSDFIRDKHREPKTIRLRPMALYEVLNDANRGEITLQRCKEGEAKPSLLCGMEIEQAVDLHSDFELA